jgi:hypothetical protein
LVTIGVWWVVVGERQQMDEAQAQACYPVPLHSRKRLLCFLDATPDVIVLAANQRVS